MRRRESRRPCRAPFALWLDAINCTDEEWLTFVGGARWDSLDVLVRRWQAWPRHREHVLWWAK